MKYELAKELKDSGFPQGGNGAWIVPPDSLVSRNEDRVYVPTLEELIEACGEKFGSVGVQSRRGDSMAWEAKPLMGVLPDQTLSRVGSSAAEAVALLWLALYENVGGNSTN